MAKVLGVVYRALSTHLIKKSRLRKAAAQTGTVTLIQRFGSALNLGVCPRTFRRTPATARRAGFNRYEENGLDGLIDKRLAQVSHRRAPVDEVMRRVDRYRNPSAGSGTTGIRAGM